MAIAASNNNSQITTVLTIDTSQSQQSIKGLRQYIKGLKDELLNLDHGTEEYTKKLVELGEAQHQLREMTEDINRTNSDFGQTISNITNSIAGGVGAVQALTSGLNLLGISVKDDDALVNKLVKSMALLQGLSSIDRGIKSIRALTTVLKGAVVAAGGLGNALKGLMLSNPFTAAIAGATALAAVFVKIKNNAKEAAQAAAEELKNSINKTLEIIDKKAESVISNLNRIFTVITTGTNTQIDALTNSTSEISKMLNTVKQELTDLRTPFESFDKYLENIDKAYKDITKSITDINDKIREEQNKSADQRNESVIKQLESDKKLYTARLGYLKQEYELVVQVKDRQSEALGIIRKLNDRNTSEENRIAYYESLYNIMTKIGEILPEVGERMKDVTSPDNVKTLQEYYNNYNKLWVVYQQFYNDIRQRGAIQLLGEKQLDEFNATFKLAVADAQDIAATARNEQQKRALEQWKKHLSELLNQYNKHLSERKKAAERLRKEEELETRKSLSNVGTSFTFENQTGDSKQISTAIANLERLKQNYNSVTKEINEYIAANEEEIQKLEQIKSPTKEIKERIAALKDEIIDYKFQLKENAQAYKEETEAQNENIKSLIREYNQRLKNVEAINAERIEIEKSMQIQSKYANKALDIFGNLQDAQWWNGFGKAGSEITSLMQQIEELSLQLEILQNQYDGLQNQKELIKEQLDSGLIDYATYAEQLAEIDRQITENRAQQNAIQEANDKAHFDKTKAMLSQYVQFTSGMASAITSVLDSLAEQEDISFEEQKKLKIASATVSTINGTIAAFMDVFESVPMFPLNVILAAATSASVLATGLLNISKIKKTTKENANVSATAPSSSATKVVSSAPSIVNLNDVRSDLELPDTKVYVLESDITTAQRKVRVAENNSTL